MWSSLAFATLALAQPELCELQPGAAWPSDERHVAALACRGRPGFFVPSLEYRRLAALEAVGDQLALATAEAKELRIALAAAETSALRWREVADRDRADKLEAARQRDELAERIAEDSPATWFAWGALAGAGAVAVVVVGLALFFNSVGG